MAESRWADALSVFQDALSSAVGRGVSFFVVCWASMVGTFALHDLKGASQAIGDLSEWTYMAPIAWLFLAVAGLAQVWGLLSYVLLAGVFVTHMKDDHPVVLTLTLAALLQSFETWRCAMHAAEWQWTLARGLFLAGWAMVAGGFAVIIWRENAARSS